MCISIAAMYAIFKSPLRKDFIYHPQQEDHHSQQQKQCNDSEEDDPPGDFGKIFDLSLHEYCQFYLLTFKWISEQLFPTVRQLSVILLSLVFTCVLSLSDFSPVFSGEFVKLSVASTVIIK